MTEAVINAARHGDAETCTVELADGTPGYLTVRIEDDGQGIGAEWRAGVGITSMRERALELGGSLEVAALPRGGTCVEAQLPWEAS